MKYDFSNRGALAREWDIKRLPAYKYNGEYQQYVDSAETCNTEGGLLRVTAKKVGGSYKSCRLHSRKAWT